MKNILNYLKQFVAWVTDFRFRYTNNLFFRTTVHVILVQAALALILIGAFAVALFYMSREIISTVILHMITLLQEEGAADPLALTQSVATIQTNTILVIFIGIVLLTILFGVILSYITLRPARNSLKQQKQFISNIAHELRTPLSTIKTTTEVLLFRKDVDIEIRDALNDINEEVDRTSQIVNNLLSLNQLLRPERIEFKTVNLSEVLHTAIGQVQTLANTNGTSITIKQDDEVEVWGNASALEQVITNVLRNSINYMDPKRDGAVTIGLKKASEHHVILSVSDNGIGINQQDLLHIFEPFYRANFSRSRKPNMSNKGSGLGLAIVSEIIRIHHGKIQMESALGKGTKTIIHLPVDGNGKTDLSLTAEESDLNEVSMDFSKEKSPASYFDESSPQKKHS